MGRELGVGKGSMMGLEWLARVGAAPLEAWACAMGWVPDVARRHAKRLESQGWVVRYPMVRGSGSLLTATTAGVGMTDVDAVALQRAPAPTWWAHLSACGWTAAWLTARGRTLIGSRELEADSRWQGEIQWSEARGPRTARHRPDLVSEVDGVAMAMEVELARKSTERLRAILGLHAQWRDADRTGGVMYVTPHARASERIEQAATQAGLTTDGGTFESFCLM